MKHSFFKFHGAGNDFILIDNRNQVNFSTNQINLLCNRRLGIGADGFIFLDTSRSADFAMHYYNADGKLASLCGNGSRCIVAFANYLKIIDLTAKFEAYDGIHCATIIDYHKNHWTIRIDMMDTTIAGVFPDGYLLDTGSPHFVQFCNDIESLNVFDEGRSLRYDSRFPDGVNVDFVKSENETLFVRTYERGVEDETLSCGTGVCASALAFTFHHKDPDGYYEIPVKTKGGDFTISFLKKGNTFSKISLIGPVILSFCGTFEL